MDTESVKLRREMLEFRINAEKEEIEKTRLEMMGYAAAAPALRSMFENFTKERIQKLNSLLRERDELAIREYVNEINRRAEEIKRTEYNPRIRNMLEHIAHRDVQIVLVAKKSKQGSD